MVICGVVAAHPLLTYPPRMLRCGARSALHLTIPEQAPTPTYSDGLLASARHLGGQALIHGLIGRRETAEDDLTDRRVPVEERRHLAQREARRTLQREAVGACRDRGECDRPDPVNDRQPQAVAITRGEPLVFSVPAPLPDGADRVDDVPRRKVVPLGDLGLAGGRPAERPALLQQARAGRTVDGAGPASPPP